ncbi:MAG TPA: bifunctional 5,10-methylenetetrahydrofolate dehydrogenase/5,10-methenyltetrahydrofolate cyclohydrolase, partial [Solirubrobacterales bacterium]
MAARVIDGKAVAAAVRERVKVDVAAYEEETGRTPGLATVLVGDDPASEIYVSNKRRTTEEVGMRSIHHGPEASIREDELLNLVRELGEDDEVDGILVQLPLPAHIDSDVIVQAINPKKDVDGLTPVNAGLLAHGTPGLVPCTPAGVMELLAHEGIELEGAEAVVVGRSKLVGVPVARLLLAANATVTICHSRTRDLDATCRRADVLVAAVGVPRLLGVKAVKPGAVVIDVGMNRLEDGLAGDVDYEAAAEVAAAITPVPGGVGPM